MIGEPKTDAGRRTVAITPPMRDSLTEHLRRRLQKRGELSTQPDEWRFPSPNGGPAAETAYLLEPVVGIEPTTSSLQERCSAN